MSEEGVGGDGGDFGFFFCLGWVGGWVDGWVWMGGWVGGLGLGGWVGTCGCGSRRSLGGGCVARVAEEEEGEEEDNEGRPA